MSLQMYDTLKEFLIGNKDIFEEELLQEAVNVKDKIEEIHRIGNINLVNNAHTIVLAIVEEREQDLIDFADQEGEIWAKASLTLAFKLEWVQSIRRTLWRFLHKFNVHNDSRTNVEEFFEMEKKYNDLVDQFQNCFFISYSKTKDELLAEQRKLVENLSVPIIPVTATTGILPLIGKIDETRVKSMEIKIFEQIGASNLETIVLDMSGVAYVEMFVVDRLVRIIDGLAMMGCKAVITGIRPEVAKSMVEKGLSFENKAESKGTLQAALIEFFQQQEVLN